MGYSVLDGYWSDAGTFESLLRAGIMVKKRRLNTAYVLFWHMVNSPQSSQRAQRHCYLNFASFAFFAVNYYFNYIFLQPPAATTTHPQPTTSRHTHPLTRRKILSSPAPPNPCLMNHHGWLHPATLTGSECRVNHLNDIINIFQPEPPTLKSDPKTTFK